MKKKNFVTLIENLETLLRQYESKVYNHPKVLESELWEIFLGEWSTYYDDMPFFGGELQDPFDRVDEDLIEWITLYRNKIWEYKEKLNRPGYLNVLRSEANEYDIHSFAY